MDIAILVDQGNSVSHSRWHIAAKDVHMGRVFNGGQGPCHIIVCQIVAQVNILIMRRKHVGARHVWRQVVFIQILD